MTELSLGIMAYNEEANIGRLLEAVFRQRLEGFHLAEVFVVASGCTDRTEEITRRFAESEGRLRLLVQARREGKASAINLFLAQAAGEVLILESGDTLPAEGTLGRLVAPFADPRVGMTGARPVPVNPRDTFLGFAVHFQWAMHHQVALHTPKLGELVAFRRLFAEIPVETAVDEASIEALVTRAGYRLVYAPEALVLNKGPETIADFLRQRRRIAAGHRCLLHREGYEVSTHRLSASLRALVACRPRGPRETIWTAGVIALEGVGRLLGGFDHHVRRRSHRVWDVAVSTKRW